MRSSEAEMILGSCLAPKQRGSYVPMQTASEGRALGKAAVSTQAIPEGCWWCHLGRQMRLTCQTLPQVSSQSLWDSLPEWQISVATVGMAVVVTSLFFPLCWTKAPSLLSSTYLYSFGPAEQENQNHPWTIWREQSHLILNLLTKHT